MDEAEAVTCDDILTDGRASRYVKRRHNTLKSDKILGFVQCYFGLATKFKNATVPAANRTQE